MAASHSASAGDRLRPGPMHPRWAVLRLLGRAMERVAAGDTLPPGGPGTCMVDLGCGTRPYESLFADRWERIVGADLAGNPAADVAIGDDGRTPLPDGDADVVLSNQVLEHVRDPGAHLGEARRLLRTGGVLVLSTHGIWAHHPDPEDHRRWTRQGLRAEIEGAGFTVTEVTGVLGAAGCAVQLWQDATVARLPGILRRPYAAVLQRLAWVCGRRGRGTDCALYLVTAVRRDGATPA